MAIRFSINNNYICLEFSFPQSVEVAVFINGYGFVVADAYHSFGLVFQVHTDTAIFGFHIDK